MAPIKEKKRGRRPAAKKEVVEVEDGEESEEVGGQDSKVLSSFIYSIFL